MGLLDDLSDKDKQKLKRLAGAEGAQDKVREIRSARRKKTDATLGAAFPELLPDAARNLKLPEGYRIEDNKLFKSGEDELLITTTPIFPIERITDLDDESLKLRTVIAAGKDVREIMRAAEELADQRRIIGLAGRGGDISSHSAAKMVAFIQAFRRANELPATYQTSRLGYRPIEKKKIYLLDKSYPEEGKLSFQAESEADQRRQLALAPIGDLDGWREVWRLILPFPRVIVTVLAGLYPMVRELLQLPSTNFILHLAADSSTGKSVAQKVGLSVWADPESDQWRHHGHATFAGIEAICLKSHGLPVVIEDLQLLAEADRPRLIYAVGNEQFKARGGKQTRTQWPWHGVIIASGEWPLLSEESAGGEAARVIEIRGSPFNTRTEQIGRLIDQQILPGIRENHALLGRAVIEALLKLGPDQIGELKEQHQRAQNRWIEKAEHHSRLSRQSTQWATLEICAALLGPIFSIEEADQARKAVGVCFEECRKQEEPDRVKKAYELLRSAIMANAAYCYTDQEIGLKKPERTGTVVGVINRKERWVACYRSFAERELRQQGFLSPSRQLQAMKERGYLKADEGHLTYPIRIEGDRPRMICLRPEEDEDRSEEEEIA